MTTNEIESVLTVTYLFLVISLTIGFFYIVAHVGKIKDILLEKHRKEFPNSMMFKKGPQRDDESID